MVVVVLATDISQFNNTYRYGRHNDRSVYMYIVTEIPI